MVVGLDLIGILPGSRSAQAVLLSLLLMARTPGSSPLKPMRCETEWSAEITSDANCNLPPKHQAQGSVFLRLEHNFQ